MQSKRVASIIQEARKLSGYTQTEYGKMFGVSKQAVCSWEKGRNMPNAEIFLDILKIGGMFVDDVDYAASGFKKAVR